MEGSGRNGIAGAVNAVTERARSLVRLEVELATMELKQKVAALGAGVGALVAGAVLALFALGFALATIAAGLATFLPSWLALLILTLALALFSAIVVALGLKMLRRGTPPIPEKAIVEAKETGDVLRGRVDA